MNNALLPPTGTSSPPPAYARASTYAAWIQLNAGRVTDHWSALELANGRDPNRVAYAELVAFSHSQFEASRIEQQS